MGRAERGRPVRILQQLRLGANYSSGSSEFGGVPIQPTESSKA